MEQTTDVLAAIGAHGLSQSEIARRTGIPQPRLSRWMSGETPKGADDVLKLLALLKALQDQPATTGAA